MMLWSLLTVLLLAMVVPPTTTRAQSSVPNLYQLLGVQKSASTQEIKRAYRKKARDTHPDKNINVPPEEAAEKFRQVVQAFEILSDPSSRRHYDQTGRIPGSGGSGGGSGFQQNGFRQRGSWTFNFNFNFQHQQRRQPVQMKDKPEVKRAQARLMHIVSLEQFQTVLMDDDGRLERHVLLAAVNPQLETLVMDDIVFPFPFAGMSPQHIWWEDVLQTVIIRYHNENELIRELRLPRGQDLKQPFFLLGRKGQTIDEPWSRFQTTRRKDFETWVWNQIQVQMYFVNHHDHPVEIYWIDGTRAHMKEQVQPGARAGHKTHLTHEWYVRDSRVDAFGNSPGRWKLTAESTLMTFKVQNATSPQFYHIPRRTCFDMSGHCTFWKGQNQCRENPNFMNVQCRLSCEQCSDEQDQINVEMAKNFTYVPPNAESTNGHRGEQPIPQTHDEL